MLTKTLTVLIVEDDQMMQVGISSIISQQTGLTVAGCVTNGQQAIQQALQLKPDIILMDLALPGLNGIEATQRIKAQLPDTRVVILTSYTNSAQVLEAFASGADAYCVKGVNIQQLQAAITAVSEGSVYLDAKIASYVLQQQQNNPEALNLAENIGLNTREMEILDLIAQGLNNSEIGLELNLSVNTIKGYVRQIFTKLQVNNRVQAAIKAAQLGLVTTEW